VSNRPAALVVAVLGLGLGAAALWFGRGRAPGAVESDAGLASDEGGVLGPGALPETAASSASPADRIDFTHRPSGAALDSRSEVPVSASARGVTREPRTIRGHVLEGVRPAPGRWLRVSTDVGGSGEVDDDGEVELTVDVDPRLSMPRCLWVEGLYPDQRRVAFPIDRSVNVTIERPRPGRGRCRVGVRLERSYALHSVAVLVSLERIGAKSTDVVDPLVVAFAAWNAPGDATTIGGLVPGRYRVSGTWGETPIPERTIEIRAEDLTLLSISAP